MWIIISGDGDIDYISVFGPFDSREEAELAFEDTPEDTDDIKWRIDEILPASSLEEYYE